MPPPTTTARKALLHSWAKPFHVIRLTIGAVDAGMLVVAQEKAIGALTLVAPHGVDADLLAASIVVRTFVHIY